jgi:hypothetical protein
MRRLLTFHFCQLTIRRKSTSWEVDSSSAGKIILHFLWNPKIHCRLQDPILGQMNPVLIPTLHRLKKQCNVIYSFTLNSFKKSLPPPNVQTKILYAFIISPIHSKSPAHDILLTLVKSTNYEALHCVIFSISFSFFALAPTQSHQKPMPYCEGHCLIHACYCHASRSQWPRGLRHEISSLARTLGSWVRIPLETWMSAFILCLCAGSGLAIGWSLVLPTLKD